LCSQAPEHAACSVCGAGGPQPRQPASRLHQGCEQHRRAGSQFRQKQRMREAHTTRTCGPRAAQACAAAPAPKGAPGAHTALGVCDPPARRGPPGGAPGGGRGPGIRGGGGMSAAAVRGAAPARAGAGTHGTLSVLRKKLSTAATASPSPACARARGGVGAASNHMFNWCGNRLQRQVCVGTAPGRMMQGRGSRLRRSARAWGWGGWHGAAALAACAAPHSAVKTCVYSSEGQRAGHPVRSKTNSCGRRPVL